MLTFSLELYYNCREEVADHYTIIAGRRLLIIIGQWIIAISGVVSAFMPTYYTYLAVRMVTGKESPNLCSEYLLFIQR